MTSGDEEQRAENEATFREANEHIRAAERALDPPLTHVPYLCECDDIACRQPISLTAAEYERIRQDGATFAIAPGHSSDGEIIEEHENYVVVRKPDRGGAVARALDPRKGGHVSDEQARRVGLNESIFRQVNEQIESLNRDLEPEDRTMTVICECGDGECTERLEISVPKYEDVRTDSRRYIIISGHGVPEFESIVEDGDGYQVVEKVDGTAAEVAEETDPRS